MTIARQPTISAVTFDSPAGRRWTRSRALRLVGPPSPLSVKRSEPLALAWDMPALPAFLTLARPLFDRLAAGEGAPAEQLTADSIHELRVAARRLRELLSAFQPVLDETAVVFLREELAWIHHQLSVVRDWDVFIAVALTPLLEEQAAGRPRHRGMRDLLEAAETRRVSARTAARAALRGRRYALCLLRCGFWFGCLAATASPGPGPTFAETMRGALRRRYRRIVRYGYRQSADDKRIHRLRLRLKKLADLLEFTKTVAAGKRAEAFARRLAGLQRALGKLQDAAVVRDRAAMLGADVEQASDIARILARRQRRRIAEQRREAAKAWRRFPSLKDLRKGF